MAKQVKSVISYEDDVFAWVYLDQIDRLIRYEAYVVDYGDDGERTTLEFVIEEGILGQMSDIPLFACLLQQFFAEDPLAQIPFYRTLALTEDGRLVTAAPLMFFYNSLPLQQLAEIHNYFAAQEHQLKKEKKALWTRKLRALGFDVMSSLN